jgi:putative methionine-R-sulfoxide reductase with GAF domain
MVALFGTFVGTRLSHESVLGAGVCQCAMVSRGGDRRLVDTEETPGNFICGPRATSKSSSHCWSHPSSVVFEFLSSEE